MGSTARGSPKLSMPDDRAFFAKTVCAAGPAVSCFLFRFFWPPALMHSGQHHSHLTDPNAGTKAVRAKFTKPRTWAARPPTALSKERCMSGHAEERYPEVGRGIDGIAAPVSASVMVLSPNIFPLNLIFNFGALGIPAAWSGLISAGLALFMRPGPGPIPSVRVGLAVASILSYLHAHDAILRCVPPPQGRGEIQRSTQFSDLSYTCAVGTRQDTATEGLAMARGSQCANMTANDSRTIPDKVAHSWKPIERRLGMTRSLRTGRVT